MYKLEFLKPGDRIAYLYSISSFGDRVSQGENLVPRGTISDEIRYRRRGRSGRAGISRVEFGFTREKRRSATSDEVARRSVETSSRPLSGMIAWDQSAPPPPPRSSLVTKCTRDSRVRSSHGITTSSEFILLVRDLTDLRGTGESTTVVESGTLYEL